MKEIEEFANEQERISNKKSTMLLVIAIALAAAVTIWVILAFNKDSSRPDKLGHKQGNQIIVSNNLKTGNYIL
jgi:hypothetical protein